MRDLGLVATIVAIGLAVVGVAVFALHDKSVLVSPPDAVAEAFVRELGMARYDLARRYLARDVKRQTSPIDLTMTFEPLRRRSGKPDQVVTQTSALIGETARVLATLEGREGTASMYVDLVREDGVWKIGAWPLDIVAK